MARVFAMLLVILCASTASADSVDRNIRELASDHSYKVRLAAALALSKSKDARAVLAVSDTLSHDEDPTVRRVAALALEKMIDVHTPEDAKQLGLAALDNAAANDADERVRGTASASLRAAREPAQARQVIHVARWARGVRQYRSDDRSVSQGAERRA